MQPYISRALIHWQIKVYATGGVATKIISYIQIFSNPFEAHLTSSFVKKLENNLLKPKKQSQTPFIGIGRRSFILSVCVQKYISFPSYFFTGQKGGKA